MSAEVAIIRGHRNHPRTSRPATHPPSFYRAIFFVAGQWKKQFEMAEIRVVADLE
jgi:hypothetical protein